MELSIEQALQEGIAAHRDGKLQDAERLYRAILQSQPSHPDANHNLGVLAVSVNKTQAALQLFKTALKANSTVEQFWLSYIDALIKEEQFENSKLVIEQAKKHGVADVKLNVLEAKLAPDSDKSTNVEPMPPRELSDSLLLHYQSRRFSDAEKLALEITRNFPKDQLAWKVLGGVFGATGRMSEAAVANQAAVALLPQDAEARYNLGITLKELGRLDEAEASYQQAIALKPDFAEAHSNLGNVLKGLGRLEEAVASCNRSIALKPDSAEAHSNLGVVLNELGSMTKAAECFTQAIALKPDFTKAYWNLHGIQKTIKRAEHWIDKCLEADEKHVKAKLTKTALRFYQGDKSDFNNLMRSELQRHPYVRSFAWVFGLPKLPELHFNKFYFFDAIIKQSITSRPFYEFGVWRASSFKYLINFFKKGYGFDTFTGLPKEWNVGNRIEKVGTYTSDGAVPQINGGEFIVGKFEDTLPIFFSKSRPIASVINFDADLYSSTICALNFSKAVIDEDTVLIFDQLIINESWEQDEFKALNEFCSKNHCNYEVIAISFFTKQVAVKVIGI